MSVPTLGEILTVCKQTQEDVSDLKQIVCGTPTDASTGLIVRIDRIEQSAAVVRKIFWVVVAVVMAILAIRFIMTL